jgi:hypothetical protein
MVHTPARGLLPAIKELLLQMGVLVPIRTSTGRFLNLEVEHTAYELSTGGIIASTRSVSNRPLGICQRTGAMIE